MHWRPLRWPAAIGLATTFGLWAVKGALEEWVFSSLTSELEHNAWVVGEFLAWRWSPLALGVALFGATWVLATIFQRRDGAAPPQPVADMSKPNIVFDGFAPVPNQPQTLTETAVANGKFQVASRATFAEFCRARFVNASEGRGSNSEARDVHALIVFYNEDGVAERLRVHDGRWEDNEGRSLPRLPASGESAILDIATKVHDDDRCCGWDYSEKRVEPGLPAGVYQVSVRIGVSNDGVPDQEFWFTLRNPGKRGGMALTEREGYENTRSAERERQRAIPAIVITPEPLKLDRGEFCRDAIAQLDPLIVEGNQILESCGRPREHYRGADPLYFQNECMPKINKFARDAYDVVKRVAPEWVGKFHHVGNVTHDTDIKPAMVQQLEKWLKALGEIQDDFRKRLPTPHTEDSPFE